MTKSEKPAHAAASAPVRTRAFGVVDVVLWICVLLMAAFIFFMSAHTASDFKDGTDIVAQVKRALDAWQRSVFGASVDIVSSCAHFCEYAIFGALLFAAVSRRRPPARAFAATTVALAVAIASAYGVTDEFHQLFVPGRACDPVDWLVDTAGATLGSVCVRAALAHLHQKSKKACN